MTKFLLHSKDYSKETGGRFYIFLRRPTLLPTREQHTPHEAYFDLYGDDNGPGPEPPPQDRICLPCLCGRAKPPAGGLRWPSERQSLIAFVRTLYRSVGRPQQTTYLSICNSMMQCRTEDHLRNTRAIRLALTKIGSFDVILSSKRFR